MVYSHTGIGWIWDDYLFPRPLWLLDEPLNGLDKQGETWLATKINAVARQSCVLLVCHDHGFMAQFGAHVYEL